MNVYEAVNKACDEKTLVEALSYICTWENERAVEQALKQERGPNGQMWDTCFKFCIQLVFEKWALKFGEEKGPDLQAELDKAYETIKTTQEVNRRLEKLGISISFKDIKEK